MFQVGHSQFEFPATFGEEMQKGLCCRQNSNPRPSGYKPDMLPQIQIQNVQLETRSILMGKIKMASVQDTCPHL